MAQHQLRVRKPQLFVLGFIDKETICTSSFRKNDLCRRFILKEENVELGQRKSDKNSIDHTFLGENSPLPNPHPKEIYSHK